ncbi:unnamed protein product [Cylindrotheca closterium]|uniref:Glycosyltransferase family 92 protein n=1 Tax=Cylindrotheca closterium TaxID=2856 RepID=A0AAD2FFK9_9STRA|nr:unnamed protein product [Cylindrotheca closterium]
MAKRLQSVTIITRSFVGLYLVTCIWSFTKLSKDADSSTSCHDDDPTQSLTGQPRDLLQRRVSFQHQMETKSYNFTAALCVCVKDAEAYFEEFIDYHLAMGFSNVYLYDDSPNFELQRWYNHTRAHPDYSKVEVMHLSDARKPKGSSSSSKEEESNDDDDNQQSQNNQQQQEMLPVDPQTDYYEDCVHRFGFNGPRHDYFAFIDVDEFFVLVDESKYRNILDLLQDYLVPFGGALTVNWMLVGSANKSVYAPLPITKRFQYRDEKAHFVIKSIVKTSDYLGHRNPHAVYVRDVVVNGTNTSNIHTTAYPGANHKYALTPRGATDKTCPSKVVLLYHYRYTSDKEYIFKRCTRGGTDGGHYWCSDGGQGIRQGYGPQHIQSIPGSVFDDKAWKFLTSHVPKYQMYDSFEDFH